MKFSSLSKRAAALEDLPAHYMHPVVASIIADLCQSGETLELEVNQLRATLLSVKGALDAKASNPIPEGASASSAGESSQGQGSAGAEGILGNVVTKSTLTTDLAGVIRQQEYSSGVAV